MRLPDLPRGNKSRVYERIIQILQKDSVLSAYFNKDNWFISKGEAFDPAEAAKCGNPVMYLNAKPYSQSFYGPDSQSGFLLVDIYVWLPGNNEYLYNAFNVLDLWDVIERCFYPVGIENQNLLRKSLTEVGAKTGLVMFSQPFNQNVQNNAGFCSYGQIQIDVIRRLTP